MFSKIIPRENAKKNPTSRIENKEYFFWVTCKVLTIRPAKITYIKKWTFLSKEGIAWKEELLTGVSEKKQIKKT